MYDSKDRLARVLESFNARLTLIDQWQAEATEHLVQLREGQHATNNHLTALIGLVETLKDNDESDLREINALQRSVGKLSDQVGELTKLVREELGRALLAAAKLSAPIVLEPGSSATGDEDTAPSHPRPARELPFRRDDR